MPEIDDIFNAEERRESLLNSLRNNDSVLGTNALAQPISYRDRIANEQLQEYRQLEFAFYESTLEGRYVEYLSTLEKEMLGVYGYGGMATVVNKMNQGLFTIPEEIIRFDLYDVQSNSAMHELIEIGIPAGADAQAMATYLEGSAWRSAIESSIGLKGIIDPSIKNLVNAGMEAHLTVPGFGRAEFVELLSSPFDGKPPAMSEARARMIARTEATRARNNATEDLAQAMKSQGYKIVEIWRIAMNTNVCPDCEALEGTVRGVGWTDYPPLHPNCDCDVEIETLETGIG